MLILPVHVPRFVEKAYQRGADAVTLDLEDSVPPAEKAAARALVKDAIALAGRGGAQVLVRVNNEPDHLRPDLEASVVPGLHAIFMPKVETAEDLIGLETHISELEAARGIEAGSIRVSVHIESPLGLLNMRDSLAVSTRVESASLGVDDYCLQLGVEPSQDAMELLFPFCTLITVCKAAGISPLGILGTVAGFRDLDGFRRAAESSRQLGCEGAFCIHPDQVAVLNQVFSPAPGKIDHARRVVNAFEEGLKAGRAAISLDGRMVDTPVYKQARAVVDRAETIAVIERRKAEALGGSTKKS
jgi:citrate lyase subunit beta/citryl-CoA lyase